MGKWRGSSSNLSFFPDVSELLASCPSHCSNQRNTSPTCHDWLGIWVGHAAGQNGVQRESSLVLAYNHIALLSCPFRSIVTITA